MRDRNVTPPVVIDLKGPDGNTLAILAACERSARIHGWSADTVSIFRKEFLSGTREHALDVLFECFDVNQVQVVTCEVDRSQAM